MGENVVGGDRSREVGPLMTVESVKKSGWTHEGLLCIHEGSAARRQSDTVSEMAQPTIIGLPTGDDGFFREIESSFLSERIDVIRLSYHLS